MDNLTHTLFAVTLARTPLSRAGRGTTATLVVASNVPDIDIVAAAGGAANYLRWHRGPTHGPVGIIGLALIVAAIVWSTPRVIARVKRSAERTDGRASFLMLAALSMIATLLHVLMDLPTSYGTRLLSPFDWHWFAFDWMPIIDIYLLVAMIAGLAFGRGSAVARHRNAALVLAIMAAIYGVRAYAHHEAMSVAPRLFGPRLPAPCNSDSSPSSAPIDRWPRPESSFPASEHRCLVEIAAIPTFASPFSWRVIAQTSNAYELHDVDLLDARFRGSEDDSHDRFRRLTIRYPNQWTPEVMRAAAAPTAQTFLGFSRFPAARSVTDARGATTVRWTDMRFVAGIASLDQPTPRIAPFTALVRIDSAGRIVYESLGNRTQRR